MTQYALQGDSAEKAQLFNELCGYNDLDADKFGDIKPDVPTVINLAKHIRGLNQQNQELKQSKRVINPI